MKILAIALLKFNSVAYSLDTATHHTAFETIALYLPQIQTTSPAPIELSQVKGLG
jgi:hypothetical protein